MAETPRHGGMNRRFALLPAAALAMAIPAHADDLAAHDSNAPVNYTADRIELQDKAQRVVLTGNVEIVQGDLTMRAPRTTVAYLGGTALKIQRVDASGGVTVVRGDETAHGDVAVYDFNRRIITMVGNVTIKRGSADAQHSGRVVVDLNSHHTVSDAGPGGRVSGTFQVDKK